MCKKIRLSDRNEIIKKFPMPDRKPSYDSVEEAVEYALKKSFKDINYRTLHKNDLGEKLSSFLEDMQRKKTKKDGMEDTRKSEFIMSLQCIKIITAEEKNGRCLKKEEQEIISKTVLDWKENKNYDITEFLINHLRKNNFVDCFAKYFSNKTKHHCNEADFDAWHNKMCKMFYSALTLYYKDAAYGKAQKIVNMMFKHLYCIRIENNLLEDKYFKYCHLTLDSFTLEWFRRSVAEKWYNADKSHENEICTNGENKKSPKWSNMEYRDVKNPNYDVEEDRCLNGCYHYMFFQTLTRLYVQEKKIYDRCTVFQAEFYIWPEIQAHLAMEALFGQSVGEDEMLAKIKELHKEKINHDQGMAKAKKVFRDLSLKEKGEILIQKIDIILSHCPSQN